MAKLSPYLSVIDEKYDSQVHGEFEEDFEREHFKSKLKWDDFQIHSYQAIKRGDNLLVVAPTSSGKTSVARYATLYNLIEKGGVVIYTTPIKSLSNEKYEEMKAVLAPYGITPGLLTGDQKINIDSKFLIMTAEILSNSLFMLNENNAEPKQETYLLNKNTIKSISCVVIDEIHFISDRSRGHIWENTLILLNKDVQIVGLSATIDTPEFFGSWIGSIKEKPITLVKKYDRPVPLEFAIFDGTYLNTFMDSDNNYKIEVFQNSLKTLQNNEKKHEKFHTDKVQALLNDFIQYSKDNNLLQLCFIIFSKRNCEKFADTVKVSLIDGKESTRAVKALEHKMGMHLKSYETMPRYLHIKSLIQKGVCYHHAGIPVIMKEIVEYLYKEGHIKVLFATETVAIGVNMPIRTLVLTSTEKRVGTKIQSLDAAEFKQICGRAGRRGLDTKGLVVFLPLYDLPSELYVRNELMFGSMPKIVSRMSLTYHSYLKLILTDATDKDSFFSNSLLSVQHLKMIDSLEKEIQDQQKLVELSQSALSNITKNDDSVMKALREYAKLQLKSLQTDFAIKVSLNRQQLKQQKQLEQTVRVNKNLYELVLANEKETVRLHKLLMDKSDYVSFKDDRFHQIVEFLEEAGYLEDSKPTIYGKMVALINECNPFILVEMFDSAHLTPKQLVCVLSTLTDSMNDDDLVLDSVDVDSEIKDMIKHVENRVKYYVDLEQSMNLESENEYWRLSYDYLELTSLWCDIDLEKEDHSRILTKLDELGEYEGSFVKNMLKLNNIVDNLISLCNLVQQFDILPNLQEIGKLLMKGMVNVDSLHIN